MKIIIALLTCTEFTSFDLRHFIMFLFYWVELFPSLCYLLLTNSPDTHVIMAVMLNQPNVLIVRFMLIKKTCLFWDLGSISNIKEIYTFMYSKDISSYSLNKTVTWWGLCWLRKLACFGILGSISNIKDIYIYVF